MCSICHCVPCRARCPNSTDNPHGVCAFCKNEIFEGDVVYTDKYENIFCSGDCAADYHQIHPQYDTPNLPPPL